MAYEDEQLLPISAVQHLAFCERRCALIYMEGCWADNPFTVEGQLLHERVHQVEVEVRGDLRIVRGLRLQSLRLGLTGQADVVEFNRCADGAEGVALPELQGRWQPYPVEYKRGRPRPEMGDEAQLCAQAMCLEEMLGATIPEGSLYYGRTHRRHRVPLTPHLRALTTELAMRLHELIAAGITPPALYESKCRGCSMLDLCLPQSVGAGHSARRYMLSCMSALLRSSDEETV